MIGIFSDSCGDLGAFEAAYELLRSKGAKRFFFTGGRYADLDAWVAMRGEKARGGRAYSDKDFLAEADNRLMLLDPHGAVTPIPIKLLVAARGSFSPDGTHIVFSGSEDGGANNIYTARLDGSELVRVTHTPETKSAGTGAAESGTDRAGYPLPAGGATAGQPLRPRAGQPSIRRPEFTARELQRIQIQGRTSTVPS